MTPTPTPEQIALWRKWSLDHASFRAAVDACEALIAERTDLQEARDLAVHVLREVEAERDQALARLKAAERLEESLRDQMRSAERDRDEALAGPVAADWRNMVESIKERTAERDQALARLAAMEPMWLGNVERAEKAETRVAVLREALKLELGPEHAALSPLLLGEDQAAEALLAKIKHLDLMNEILRKYVDDYAPEGTLAQIDEGEIS